MKKISFKNKKEGESGMTLVELIVVCSIFIILSGISIFNYSKFNSHITIQNLTDDISLSIRKTQSYAISAKGVAGGFSQGFGISFSDKTTTGSESYGMPHSKSFTIFTDIPPNQGDKGNNRFDYIGQDSPEIFEVLKVISADKIKKINIYNNNNGLIAVPDGGGYLDIVFQRPEPDANFCYRASITSVNCLHSTSISYAQIIISNKDDTKTKTITIRNTGQMSVQ